MGSYGIGVGRNWPASSRPTTTRRVSSGQRRSAPVRAHLVAIGANKEPRVTEVAERLHDVAQERRLLAATSSTTTATSRRREVHRRRAARDAVDPHGLAALAGAGGVEVTERATGERSTRPLEEVERMLVEGFDAREAAA
jgi:hypothetical protein